MGLPSRIFAYSFESLYHVVNKKKTCSRQLTPDLLDGREWSIEAFYQHSAQYFDRPCDFFTSFCGASEIGLREGTHPRDTWEHHPNGRPYLFDSPVRSEWKENDLVPFRWFRRADPGKTLLLFVPGWGRSSQSFEEGMCARLLEAGLDAGLITKPFHQARTPIGSFTGEYFISANLFWTIANFRQLVAEIRLITQYMRRYYSRIGIIGMSSGGFQAGLAANCEPYDYFFPFITGCGLGGITWHGLITQYVRRDLEARGVSEQELTKAWSITDLAVVGKNCQARRIKHYISRYDRVVPTRFQEALWETYGRRERMDLEASHYSAYFLRNRVIDDIIRVVEGSR